MNQRKKTFRVTAVLILVSVLLLLPVAVTAADSAIDADQNIVSAAPTRSGAFENWKQNDPRWRDQSLGYSSVGRSGCYVTSLAMILVASGLDNDFL